MNSQQISKATEIANKYINTQNKIIKNIETKKSFIDFLIQEQGFNQGNSNEESCCYYLGNIHIYISTTLINPVLTLKAFNDELQQTFEIDEIEILKNTIIEIQKQNLSVTRF